MPTPIVNRPENPIASFQQTVTNASVGLTAANLIHASGVDAARARINVVTDAIRYRTDGGAPTASLGILVPAASTIEVEGVVALRNFRMIRVTTDAQVNVDTYMS